MNTYMQTSIKACIGYLKSFEQGMKVAAMRDDGLVSKDEAKLLKRLSKATDRYIDELEDMME